VAHIYSTPQTDRASIHVSAAFLKLTTIVPKLIHFIMGLISALHRCSRTRSFSSMVICFDVVSPYELINEEHILRSPNTSHGSTLRAVCSDQDAILCFVDGDIVVVIIDLIIHIFPSPPPPSPPRSVNYSTQASSSTTAAIATVRRRTPNLIPRSKRGALRVNGRLRSPW
jgi:hypothetical protein